MDPRIIGASLQAFQANENVRRKPMTEREEEAYYRRHAPSERRALRPLIAILGSLWRRFASTVETGVEATAENTNQPAAVGHSSHA